MVTCRVLTSRTCRRCTMGYHSVQMEQAMVRKLRNELQQEITTERQVVYILVELRKLMELANDGAAFFALKFFCDWAVHTELDQQGAARIVKRFDKQQEFIEEMGRAENAGQTLNLDHSFIGEV